MLEICCGDIESVIAAAKGGADRVELCSALSEGGLTPSIGLIKAAVNIPGIRVHVLIRPRNGDFLYNDTERDIMISDIEAARKAGAHGVVIGSLTPDGDIDIDTCSSLINAADGMDVTFHRAFDVCRNPEEALETIIKLGCTRILTSGQMPSAIEGTATLCRLNELASGRIILLAGAGVSSGNAKDIIIQTGIRELHASARSTVSSAMRFRNSQVSMGNKGSDEYSRLITDADIVKQLSEIVHS